MCRDWRRCPSSQGERKKSYQRARYAALPIEQGHALGHTDAMREQIVESFMRSPFQSAATARDTGSSMAEVIAGNYTPPETGSDTWQQTLATTALTPEEAAARLNDPNDPLYIDPEDTSSSANEARTAAVTLLCSPDLSDTSGMDAWVSEQCSREHSEIVATAALERTKDMHEATRDLAGLVSDADLSHAVRATGQGLSVGSGIHMAHGVEDAFVATADNTRHTTSFITAKIALDDDRARAVTEGCLNRGSREDTRAAMEDLAVDFLTQNKGRDEDEVRAHASKYMDFLSEVSKVGKFDYKEPDPKAVAEIAKMHEEFMATIPEDEKDSFKEVREVLGSVAKECSPAKADSMKFVSNYMQRSMESDPENQVNFLVASDVEQVVRHAAPIGRGTFMYCGKYTEDSFDKVRFKAISQATDRSAGIHAKEEDSWYNVVRRDLDKISPRYKDDGRMDEMVLNLEGSSQSDVDDIKEVLSMYSKEDMDVFFDSFKNSTTSTLLVAHDEEGRASFGPRRIEYMDDDSMTSHVGLRTSDVEALVSGGDISKVKATELKADSTGVFHDQPGAAISGAQADANPYELSAMRAAVDKYNALPVDKRREIAGAGVNEEGWRLEVAEVPICDVYMAKGTKSRYVIRSTSMKSGVSGKRGHIGSKIRLDGSKTTAYHEVTHMVDMHVAENNTMAHEFLSERTAGLEETVYAQDGDKVERVIADSFYTSYIGKTNYGADASEVNTMGIQVMTAHHDDSEVKGAVTDFDSVPKHKGRAVVSMAPTLIDPEHHAHTLGLLAGSPRKRATPKPKSKPSTAGRSPFDGRSNGGNSGNSNPFGGGTGDNPFGGGNGGSGRSPFDGGNPFGGSGDSDNTRGGGNPFGDNPFGGGNSGSGRSPFEDNPFA